MLTVTEEARQLLREKLREHTDDPETGIRLSFKEGGQIGIILDTETPGDQVVEHDGDKVLLVSSEFAMMLEGSKLDVRNTDEGRKLYLSKE